MKLKFLFLLTLLSFANSQIKIAGTVIDNKSGSPIPLVNIYSSSSDIGEITDNKGRLSYTLNDKQKAELIFSHVAYENYHQVFDSTHDNIVIRLNETLIQLTYVSNVAFVFDLESFELIRTYDYSGEGWGICTMSEFFVMSDGSSQLTLRDLETFQSIGTVNVTKNGVPLSYLNELECIGDMVYSNVWLTDEIVVIDIETGVVNSSINASGILSDIEYENADVLNGIAYDENNSEFWITGKYWPHIFLSLIHI